MESEGSEEMEVARDVVVIPIRDRSEESVSPYSTEDGVTLICLMSQSRPVMENWDSLKGKVTTSVGKI